MSDNKDRILYFVKEFTKRYGYTPTMYQISNELFLPHDKVSAIVGALRSEGAIQFHRPLI